MTMSSVNQQMGYTTCCSCGVMFGMPQELMEMFMEDTKKWFYCPNGHNQHFSKSKEVIWKDKFLKKEQEMTREINLLSGSLSNMKTLYDRKGKEPCPQCNGWYVNVEKHIDRQHGKG